MKNLLTYLPERQSKPRSNGVAMVMDKGLSFRQAEDLISSSHHLIDFIKLGFGTSLVTNNVEEKVKIYQEVGIKVYLGGTLFEAFVIRNMFDEYCRLIDNFGVDAVEVSDGSFDMNHDDKCKYIEHFTKNYTVLSEVGSKDANISYSPEQWANEMHSELDAGASFVIAEARESGTVGIYQKDGNSNDAIIEAIKGKIPADKVLWEAPLKSQQVWFIKNFGPNVNLGNIAPAEVIALETLRLGLRGDTFLDFLPNELK